MVAARFLLPILFSTLVLPFNSPCDAINILYSGETLQTGGSLVEGDYNFIMQQDCNLVLYENGNPIWASQTGGLGRNCYLSLRATGVLLITVPSSGEAIWTNGPARPNGNYVLVRQKDRNVVVYGPAIWSTRTNTGLIAGEGSEVASAVNLTALNATNKEPLSDITKAEAA